MTGSGRTIKAQNNNTCTSCKKKKLEQDDHTPVGLTYARYAIVEGIVTQT